MEIIKRIFIVSYGLRLRFVFIITDDQSLSSLMDGLCHQRALVLGGRNALRPYDYYICAYSLSGFTSQ
jgi:hypothetical protein